MVEYFAASIYLSGEILQQNFFTIKEEQSPSHFRHLQVLIRSFIVVDVIDSTASIGSDVDFTQRYFDD